MRKLPISLIMLSLAAFVVACQPAPSIESAASTPTATIAQAEPTSPSSPAPSSTGETVAVSAPGCTVESISFAPDPPANSTIPPVSADDWTMGPEDAPTTIIEYGDFQ